MEKLILKATSRSETPKKVRNAGFIPGVLSGSGLTSTSVQFEITPLNKIIAKHGSNAKFWVELDAKKKFGFIKEIQKNPLDGKVVHVTIQLISEDQEVKMQLPIAFHGHAELEHRFLQLQVYKSEIEVMGKAALMPEVAIVEVAEKEVGDNITADDFHLPPKIKIHDPENEIYAVIKAIRNEIIEEPAEAAPPAE